MLDQYTQAAIRRLERDAILPFESLSPNMVAIIAADKDGHESDYSYLITLENLSAKYNVNLDVIKCANEFEVGAKIASVRRDSNVNGLIVLSDFGKSTQSLMDIIPQRIDIDAQSKSSIGYLFTSNDPLAYRHAPCTAVAAYKLIGEYASQNDIDLCGKRAAVVGRSTKVGKPLAELLTRADMTVTLMHSKTEMPIDFSQYDVICSAIGKPNHFTANDIDPRNKILIDIGISCEDGGKVCGDFKTEDFGEAAYISPVPGGVGKLTSTCLFAKLFANKLALAGPLEIAQ